MEWIGGPLEVWTHPLPPPGLACVMQDLKLLSFNIQWFRDLGASFSSFGCFVFESWVLRFRVLGASFSRGKWADDNVAFSCQFLGQYSERIGTSVL